MEVTDIARIVAESIAAAFAIQATNGNNGQNGAHNGCTYRAFEQCKPLPFKGTEGPIGLTRWIEKLESVFRVSNCAEDSKVKYATCTLQDSALTWWNEIAATIGIDASYALPWEELKERMRAKYCPRSEIQKLEAEFHNLKTKGYEVSEYTNRFHELAILCPTMVTPPYKKIEQYISGLPPKIQDLITTTEPTDIEHAVRLANSLADKAKLRANAEGKSGDQKGKRKWEDNFGKNQGNQQKKPAQTS